MLHNVKANRTPASHQVAWRNGDIAAAANDHNSSLRSQQLQVVPEVPIGKHLKNEVHTPPAGFQYLFPVVRVGVIEDVTCALALHQLQAFLSLLENAAAIARPRAPRFANLRGMREALTGCR